MKHIKFVVMIILLGCVSLSAADDHPEYIKIKERLKSGWNSWNSRNILAQVLLPESFSISLAFKQNYWLEEQYLKESLIGRYGDYVEKVRPGAHAYDGSYTELEIEWEQMHARVQTAHDGEDLVILITPLKEFASPVSIIVESGMMWNRPGQLSREGNQLKAILKNKTITVHTTAEHIEDYYVHTLTPYLVLHLDQPRGISIGKKRTIEEIEAIISFQKEALYKKAAGYDELSEAYIAVQAGIAWNLIYEPKHDRVVSTVGRLWNEEYGGYCLFGWDNFFLAYMTALDNRDLAFANVLEHLKGVTDEGFIPNDNRGNGSKSFDRSQPPVGGIMIREIYKKYPERWFLESVFDDLLGWNRWWMKKRLNEGLLSYGSHEAKNPFNEPAVRTKRTAGYESGMDDSPMYIGVPFNKEKNTLELQDVGLNSLVIADCKALAEMANVLGRTEEAKELLERADYLSRNLENLWDEDFGFYLNYKTDTKELSKRLSPTMFYPLLAEVPTNKRAVRMIKNHFYNPDEFYGEWMLPSTARNDSTFERQRYWKGAIWPPLNFLTYLSLRKYSLNEACTELSEKSLKLIMTEWKRKGYVSENYSSITGTGDDERLSSDRFHSWGALFGIISFIDKGYLPPPEKPIN